MNQFESFETVDGKIVVVNKTTITYIIGTPDNNSIIFFNATGRDDKVQSLKIDCYIEEVLKILNCE